MPLPGSDEPDHLCVRGDIRACRRGREGDEVWQMRARDAARITAAVVQDGPTISSSPSQNASRPAGCPMAVSSEQYVMSCTSFSCVLLVRVGEQLMVISDSLLVTQSSFSVEAATLVRVRCDDQLSLLGRSGKC